jgi:hypothetical protein
MTHIERLNTIKVEFCETCSAPTSQELVVFVLMLELQLEEVHTLYFDTLDKCVYIKFHNANTKHEVLMKFQNVLFHYNNGITTSVNLSTASSVRPTVQYIRVFNLPPELDSSDIRDAFEEYGIVETVEREKIKQPFNFNILSGVIGIKLNVKKVIPAVVYIKDYPATVCFGRPKVEASNTPTPDVVVQLRQKVRARSTGALYCIPEDRNNDEQKIALPKARPKSFKEFYQKAVHGTVVSLKHF